MEVDLCIGSRSLQRLYHTFKCSGAEVHVAFQCRCGNNLKIIGVDGEHFLSYKA